MLPCHGRYNGFNSRTGLMGHKHFWSPWNFLNDVGSSKWYDRTCKDCGAYDTTFFNEKVDPNKEDKPLR